MTGIEPGEYEVLVEPDENRFAPYYDGYGTLAPFDVTLEPGTET